MSSKESCGKNEKPRGKSTTLSPNFDEEDKKEKKASGSTSSAYSIRSVSSEKRKPKSDHTDTLYCNTKGKPELKRFSIATEISRKRPKTSSSSHGPIELQETSFSSDNEIISQSPSSNGTKTNITKCADFKTKGIKLTNIRSKLDHELKNLSGPKIVKDV
uniref:Uncharacterized protein n=1 Tax=Loxodonta africana TaxID=9785 RepID=G3TXG1_LOXAF